MTEFALPMPRATAAVRHREVARDLFVVVVVTALSFVLASALELREHLTELTRPLERYQLDELPLTLATLAVLLAWFAWRRWRQADRELALRVEAQQALIGNEARYRTLFMENLAGNALCAHDGSMLLCNPATARILAVSSPDAAVGRNLFSFYADASLAGRHRELLRREGKLDAAGLELVAADGAPVTVIARFLLGAEPGAALQVYLADISELHLMQRELADALDENRLLSQKYLLAQEDERRHLARELHDEMGQCLNAIKLDAMSIRSHSGPVPQEVTERAQAIADVASHVYDVARGLMERLRPVALDELGLADALQHLITQWQRRNPGTSCSLMVEGDLADLGEQINMTVYRVVQECLTNVARHAQASSVQVRLVCDTKVRGLRLGVADDGVGIAPGARRRGGLGLVGLRERVEALRGRFEVRAVQPHGLEVHATIPLTEAQP